MSDKSTLAPTRGKLPAVGLSFLLAAALLVGRPGSSVVQATPPASPVASSAVAAAAPGGSYADLVSRVAPSVVTIRAEHIVRPTRQERQIPDELRRFFGDGLPAFPDVPHRQGGLGSGVIVSADGYILTNNHVVDAAEHIEVELPDRRTLSAKKVGADPASDIAVLKVEAPDLKPLPFGDSRAVRVGDVALAFGNPLGLGPTVTSGIISAKGRATGGGKGSFEDFLQTDAPINQGNSGGALVNTKGELIGINSQIVSPSGGNIGIGFAIPSSMASNVMDQLVHGGKVRRGQLGVTVQPVTSDIARSLGLKEVTGALVSSVSPDSAAEAAGVKRGDVILALNGQAITDGNSLRNEIASTKPGSNVTLTVRREGAEKKLDVKLGELNPPAERADGDSAEPKGGRLGLAVRPLTREEARESKARTGLLVDDVDEDGPAAAAGFKPGDVIQEVDGKPVTDATALRAAVKAAGDRPALVLVSRDGDSLYLPLSAGRG
jgi:serine protease Do